MIQDFTPDAVVIGGGVAGLSAAMPIARSRMKVLVVDAGLTRNRFAAASHGFLGRDGISPAAIGAEGRAQLLAYPGARVIEDEAVSAEPLPNGGYALTLASAGRVETPALVLAMGLRDRLPELPGLEERWGAGVAHCPFCHGYEYGAGPIGVLLSHAEMGVHQAKMLTQWGETILFLNGAPSLAPEVEADLRRRGAKIEPAPLSALEGPGRELSAAVLADGRRVPLTGLFAQPRAEIASPLPQALGCRIETWAMGEHVAVDAAMNAGRRGLFAAGDIARPMHAVAFAVGDGYRAGTALVAEKIFSRP